MSFFTMTFIVSILGAIIGVIKPWMGGIPGLLIAYRVLSWKIDKKSGRLLKVYSRPHYLRRCTAAPCD